MKYALAKLPLCLGALICLSAGSLAAQSRPVDSGLTAHEWEVVRPDSSVK